MENDCQLFNHVPFIVKGTLSVPCPKFSVIKDVI